MADEANYPLVGEDAGKRSQLPVTGRADLGYDRLSEDNDEINLLDYWRILTRRKWTILGIAFVAVCAAVLLTFMSTPLYKAETTLQIEKNQQSVLKFQGVESSESDAYLSYQSFYATQYELLRSKRLVRQVIEQLDLGNNKSFVGDKDASPGLLAIVIGWIRQQLAVFLPKPEHAVVEEDNSLQVEDGDNRLIGIFLANLQIEPVKDSRLVRLTYSSPDPVLASRILNTMAENYIRMNMDRRYEATAYAKQFLEERLAQMRKRLEDSEKILGEYADRNDIVNIDNRQNIIAASLEQMNLALSQAEADRFAAESEYRQIVRNKGEGLPQVLDNPVIQKYKELQTELESQYQEGLRVYKPAYPKMRQLASRIARVKDRVDQEISQIRSALKIKYETALSNEKMLKNRLVDSQKQAIAQQNRTIQFNIMKRDVDTNKELYEGLLQRYKEVGIAGGIGTNNISIVDQADTPLKPYKPRLVLNVAVALVLGMGLGVVLVFVREALDDRIKGTDDFEKALGIPALGVIPWMKEEDKRTLAYLLQEKPRISFSEAYRSTRTALQFTTTQGSPRVLAVTSTQAGEGKTTTSLSLAIAYAQSGKKVLVIDADLRIPSVAKVMNLRNAGNGLTHYLAGDAGLDAIRQETPVEHLTVIAAGATPPNPAELLASQKMLDLLATVSQSFDQVIIDCPPVLGIADALILGNMADGLLLVTDAGRTSRANVANALKRLKSARVRLVGGVLTKIDKRQAKYGDYQDYYAYYYSYGQSDKGAPRLRRG